MLMHAQSMIVASNMAAGSAGGPSCGVLGGAIAAPVGGGVGASLGAGTYGCSPDALMAASGLTGAAASGAQQLHSMAMNSCLPMGPPAEYDAAPGAFPPDPASASLLETTVQDA